MSVSSLLYPLRKSGRRPLNVASYPPGVLLRNSTWAEVTLHTAPAGGPGGGYWGMVGDRPGHGLKNFLAVGAKVAVGDLTAEAPEELATIANIERDYTFTKVDVANLEALQQ
ncbi:hypothetical protein RBB50_012826 [Rhinocladiella similis]